MLLKTKRAAVVSNRGVTAQRISYLQPGNGPKSPVSAAQLQQAALELDGLHVEAPPLLLLHILVAATNDVIHKAAVKVNKLL
jgi:hypothetical protein